jgi:hypothetical protein
MTIEPTTDIAGKPTAWNLSRKGRKWLVDKPWSEVRNWVNQRAEGKVDPNWKGAYGPMHVIAGRKGLRVIHKKGETNFILKDKNTGNEETFTSFEDVVNRVSEYPVVQEALEVTNVLVESGGGPPAAALAPETVGPSVSSPGATMSTAGDEAGLPPSTPDELGPTSLWQGIRTSQMGMFQQLDERTGI